MADLPKLPKRPDYFQAQFLVVRDFQDEQTYHAEMLRRNNRGLHEWGVVRDGLQVSMTGDKKNLSISPGSAIDSLGREIVLEADQLLGIDKVTSQFDKALGSAQDVFITITFNEVDSNAPEDKYPGTDNVTRQMQSPIIAAAKSPVTDGSVITLARVSVTSGNEVSQPDNSARKVASSFIARGSNLGDILLDGALSFTSKSSPNPTYPQVGLDYDSGSDALRVRARTKDAPALDTTHLTIKRETGSVGIGIGESDPAAKLHVGSGAIQIGTVGDFITFIDSSITHKYGSQRDPSYTINRDLLGNGNAGIGFGGGTASIQTSGSAVGIPTSKALAFYTSDGSNLAERVRIDSSGNVGIGIATPNAKLQVNGGEDTSLIIGDRGTTSGSVALQFLGTHYRHAGLRFDGDNVIVENASNSYLPSSWYWAAQPMHFIVRNGNVGIGTLAPGARLQIFDTPVDAASYSLSNWNGSGGAVSAFFKTTMNNGGSELAATQPALVLGREGVGGQAYPNFAEFKIGRYENAGVSARTRLDIALTHGNGDASGATVMTMLSSGNVGIGTESPRAKLDVTDTSARTTKSILARLSEGNTADAGTYLGVQAYDTQPTNTISFALEHRFYGTLNNAINFYRGGRETGGFMSFSTNDGSEKMWISRDGDVRIAGDTQIDGRISCGGKIGIRSSQWGTFVSAREDKSIKMVTVLDTYEMFTLEMACSRAFKENISDLTTVEALATLQNLTPVKYDYKGEKTFRQNLGFIAEDMPDNLASEDRKSISPFEVIPVLTKVAKEQQKTITALQETIRELQEQMKRHNTIITGDRI